MRSARACEARQPTAQAGRKSTPMLLLSRGRSERCPSEARVVIGILRKNEDVSSHAGVVKIRNCGGDDQTMIFRACSIIFFASSRMRLQQRASSGDDKGTR